MRHPRSARDDMCFLSDHVLDGSFNGCGASNNWGPLISSGQERLTIDLSTVSVRHSLVVLSLEGSPA